MSANQRRSTMGSRRSSTRNNNKYEDVTESILDDSEIWLPKEIPPAFRLFHPLNNAHQESSKDKDKDKEDKEDEDEDGMGTSGILPIFDKMLEDTRAHMAELPIRTESLLIDGMCLTLSHLIRFEDNGEDPSCLYHAAAIRAWRNNLARHVYVYNNLMQRAWPDMLSALRDPSSTIAASAGELQRVERTLARMRAVLDRTHSVFHPSRGNNASATTAPLHRRHGHLQRVTTMQVQRRQRDLKQDVDEEEEED